MADLFNRKTDVYGGSFAADQAFVTFPAALGNAGADIGLLVQRMGVSYQQNITRLFEVGRSAMYYVGGRTSGDASIDRVIGPRAIAENFYKKFGDLCNARTNTLDFRVSTGCTNPAARTVAQVAYSCFFCVIQAASIGTEASNMLINESLRLMFSSLDYTTFGAAG